MQKAIADPASKTVQLYAESQERRVRFEGLRGRNDGAEREGPRKLALLSTPFAIARSNSVAIPARDSSE